MPQLCLVCFDTSCQCRGWAHKPTEVKILLLALLSTEATHPKVAEMVRASGFFSFTGKPGSSMMADRAVEYINHLQDERRGKFAAFEKALEFTPHLACALCPHNCSHPLDPPASARASNDARRPRSRASD